MIAFKNFLFRELVFTVFIGFVSVILFQLIFKEYPLFIFWILLSVIAVSTGLLHYFVLQVAEKDVSKFAFRFLFVSGIKMMLYLGFITTYVFIFPEDAKSFLISFIILYLLYTAFEVISILGHLKK